MTPAQPYHVFYTGQVQDRLRELLAAAATAGVSARVARSLLEMEGHLELTPASWGDPVRHHRHAGITEYRRVHAQLAVQYAVHDTQPIVWVTKINPVLGHPLRHDNE